MGGDALDPSRFGPQFTVQGAEVVVALSNPSPSERLVAALPGLLTAAAVLVVVGLTARFGRDLRRGDVFRRQNVWRFRGIAVTMTFGSSVIAAAETYREFVFVNSLPGGATVWSLTLPIEWIIGGLVVTALAEAFAAGARLRSDVEGLV